jgi:hypothetical protein
MELKWKKGKPIVSGWYWYRSLKKCPDGWIVFAYQTGPDYMHITNFKNEWSPSDDAEYAGPIEKPEE